MKKTKAVRAFVKVRGKDAYILNPKLKQPQLQTNPMILRSALAGKLNMIFFLDRHGEQTSVILPNNKSDGDALCLIEATFSPSFEICCILDGNLITNDGDPATLNEVPALIASAAAERVRFYTEREEEYGESAWPR